MRQNEIIMTQPDDWHIHLRDGVFLQRTVADVSRYFGRAVIMPNLSPPIATVEHVKDYIDRIQSVISIGCNFKPLMTLYLQENMTPGLMEQAKNSGLIIGCKLYPQGVTTNSQHGVANLQKLFPVFEAMQEHQLILQLHGEVFDPAIDIFQREQIFIERYLDLLLDKFPKLKIVLEHITTEYAVDYVKKAPQNLGATITAHHLFLNRNDLLAGGIKPHYYCLPILKTERDREILVQAAISGDSKFFLGTDSAPHAKALKEHACGCAGIYTAHAALELYATIFEQNGALDKLEAFASFNGADFYGLPYNQNKIRLVKTPYKIPNELSFGETILVPFWAGEELKWSVSSPYKIE